ncbi:MAG: GNAT family N-acetyltransferase [Bacillota bacterium]
MQIIKVDNNKKEILKNLMTLYLHDLSEFSNDIDINQDKGLFEFDVFELFFEKEGLTPFFIVYENNIIGFILLQSGPYSNQEYADFVLNSFFILKKYRRRGLGREACKAFFNLYPGRYAVGQLLNNKPAVLYWKNVYKSLNIEFYEKEELEEAMTYQYFKV